MQDNDYQGKPIDPYHTHASRQGADKPAITAGLESRKISAIRVTWLGLLDLLASDKRAFAAWQVGVFKNMLETLTPYTGSLEGKRILDIGCGRLFSYTLLFNSLGARVTGIDQIYTAAGLSGLPRYFGILRRNGFTKFVGSPLTSGKDNAYYQTLERGVGFPLTTRGIDVREMDAEDMDFPDGTFDLAVSITVFEHLSNLEKVISEIQRVLKTGGIAYVYVHLFTALSGGHHTNWQDAQGGTAWDHLRRRILPLSVYLNEKRESEYLKLFRDRFEVVIMKDVDPEEGCALLTDAIRAELRDYSEAELLKNGIVIVARKR